MLQIVVFLFFKSYVFGQLDFFSGSWCGEGSADDNNNNGDDDDDDDDDDYYSGGIAVAP